MIGLLFTLMMQPTTAIEVYEQYLMSDDWPQQPRVEQVTQITALKKILDHFIESPGSLLSIRFPADPNGEAWAKEVSNWLTALGIPTKYIELIPGSGVPDRLVLTFVIRNTNVISK